MELRKGTLAEACADGIGTIIQDYCATGSAAPHWIADLLMNLELVARAAEIFGYGDLAATARAQKKRPNALTESGWSEKLVVLALRKGGLDNNGRKAHTATFVYRPSANILPRVEKGA